MNTKRQKTDRVSFPIGGFLAVIITIIVVASFVLIAYFARGRIEEDYEKYEKAYNFEVNWHSAKDVENTFSHIRFESLFFLKTVKDRGWESPRARQAELDFFIRNQNIAALYFPVPERAAHVFINSRFSKYENSIRDWFESCDNGREQTADGKTIILKTELLSTKIRLLAMFFHLTEDHNLGHPEFSGGVLFLPPGSLSLSYLIDSDGEVFIDTDPEIIQEEGDIPKQGFIKEIHKERKDYQNNQETLPSDGGEKYLVAYYKLNDYNSIVITCIEQDTTREQLVDTFKYILPLAGAVIAFLIALIRFFSRRISAPIEALAEATESIGGGALDTPIKDTNSRLKEIRSLTGGLINMKKVLDKFTKFTNKKVVLDLLKTEKIDSELKDVTVLFPDIRDFTKKSDCITKKYKDEASKKIVGWLNDYFTKMIKCVQDNGGIVDKFIGDAVMAHWGTADTSDPKQDAFNCIKAAIGMREALYEMNKGRTENDPDNPSIRIGCGINSGRVTAGCIGSKERMEYTVIGDPVNLASRVEGLTKKLCADILITEDTWDKVKNEFKFIIEEIEIKEGLRVKGKEKPVRLFAVINFTDSPTGPHTLAELRELLGLPTPDLSKVDVNAEEQKYTIGGAE